MNLMDFYKFGESDGWSYSLLSENMSGVGGTSGGIGIPDIVAIISLIIIFFVYTFFVECFEEILKQNFSDLAHFLFQTQKI